MFVARIRASECGTWPSASACTLSGETMTGEWLLSREEATPSASECGTWPSASACILSGETITGEWLLPREEARP